MTEMGTPTIERREDGLRWMVVREGWSADLTELVNSGRVDGIELNSAKGSWESGLGFLSEVPSLRHLILIDLEERDVSRIEGLPLLESLKLSAYAASDFNFARLRQLRKAFVEWRKHYRNLAACTNLKDLYLNKYLEGDLTKLRPLVRLYRLSIGDSSLFSGIEGIETMRELGYLGLFGLPKLRDLAPLERLGASLGELNIKRCRNLASLEPLSKLTGLRRLILEDCGAVESLRPLAGLRGLEELFFFGDTNVVDGDLDFLMSLPLRKVAFKNRRHYSLRREQLSA